MVEQDQRSVKKGARKQSWKAALFVLLCIVLITGSFGTGVGAMLVWGDKVRQWVAAVVPQAANEEQQLSREERSKLLSQVEDILKKEYLSPEKIDEQKMTYGAAAGLVASLGDAHTAFVEPLPSAILNQDMQGSFEGIGATVDLVEGHLLIVRVLPNSPALTVGLKPGDAVLEVDGQPLEGKTIVEAISLIRGPRGTVVRLKVQREGVAEPFIVPITRDKVDLPIVEARMLEGNIAYLRLAEFNAVSADRVHAALKELMASKPAGLVFDLRGNPGGYLEMAVRVAGEFLPQDALVLTERQRDKPLKEYRVERAGLAQAVPLVVLINGFSASASEIVAGAIRDSGRGTLVGEKSYGKGSVQSTHELEGGASLRVTIAKWDLPKGGNLDGNGFTPDVEVPLTTEDVSVARDPQLERAVTFLTSRN
jgi:carboxyl-terminal processing protease